MEKFYSPVELIQEVKFGDEICGNGIFLGLHASLALTPQLTPRGSSRILSRGTSPWILRLTIKLQLFFMGYNFNALTEKGGKNYCDNR